jgi:hypothetical protein
MYLYILVILIINVAGALITKYIYSRAKLKGDLTPHRMALIGSLGGSTTVLLSLLYAIYLPARLENRTSFNFELFFAFSWLGVCLLLYILIRLITKLRTK